jgi:hypothetical protein
MGSLMGGVYWVINRRMKLAARAAEGEMLSARAEDVLGPESGNAPHERPPEGTEGGKDDE